jgi:hypothetical protein
MKNKDDQTEKTKQPGGPSSDTKENREENSNQGKMMHRQPYPILGEKAEDYLREQANIEDLPDEGDEDEYDNQLKIDNGQ